MKTVNLPPNAPTLIESTRAIGYSLAAAVADIVDNSISASASQVNISFFPIGEPFISILDDGMGMNSEEITAAMQYGSKSPTDDREASDLGRFGLGLKTASLSQCRSLTIISKQNNAIEGRRWDIDYVLQTGEWSLIVMEEDEYKEVPQFDELLKYASGTLVVWQNLDKLKIGEVNFENSFGRKMDDVREHLALIYHRYLSGESGIKKLALFINGAEVLPADPFLIKKSMQAMDDETIIVRGKKVTIRPYILPHTSKLTEKEKSELGGKEGLRKQQGFYVYRNKRLLVWGTWFRMMRQGDLSKLARIQVDIPNSLDDLWTLDVKKSSAIPPEELRNNLGAAIDKIAETSKRTWTYRGKKETADSIEHTWIRFNTSKGGVFYELNRNHPLIIQIAEKAPEIRSRLESLLKQIEQSIPLNQLYVDLNNDEKIENEVELEIPEIRKMIEQLLQAMPSPSMKADMLEKVASVEPFNMFLEIIKEYKNKEEL